MVRFFSNWFIGSVITLFLLLPLYPAITSSLGYRSIWQWVVNSPGTDEMLRVEISTIIVFGGLILSVIGTLVDYRQQIRSRRSGRSDRSDGDVS